MKHLQRIARLFPWVCMMSLLLGLGCAGPQKAGRIRALDDVSFRLNQAYRWKDMNYLGKMLEQDLRPGFEKKFVEPGADLVIIDTELASTELKDEEARTALVQLEVSWYRLPSVRIVNTRLKCTLEWKDDRWRLVRQEEPGREGAGPFDLP